MRNLAWFVSAITHPLILMNLGLLSIFTAHPYFVSRYYDTQFLSLSLFMAVNTLLMPLLSMILLKRFRFISDYSISNPKERILPYGILVLLFIFTGFQLFRFQVKGLPLIFLFAATLCILLNILITSRWKISSHTIAAGGLTGLYFYLTLLEHQAGFTNLLMASVLAGGISAWARLTLQAHTEAQIYAGAGLGFATVVGMLVVFL